MNEKGKYVCAMCAAPIVLEKANLLVDKKFTAYQGYDQKIKQGTYLMIKWSLIAILLQVEDQQQLMDLLINL